MKHRVTNFGCAAIEVRLTDRTGHVSVPPGTSYVGDFDMVMNGPGRTHYSVRPAERAAAPDPFPADDEEEG